MFSGQDIYNVLGVETYLTLQIVQLDQSSTTRSSRNLLRYRSISAVYGRTFVLRTMLLFPPILCSKRCQYLPCGNLQLHDRFCGRFQLPLEFEYTLHDLWRLQNSSHCRLSKIVPHSFHCHHPFLVSCGVGHDGVIQDVQLFEKRLIIAL